MKIIMSVFTVFMLVITSSALTTKLLQLGGVQVSHFYTPTWPQTLMFFVISIVVVYSLTSDSKKTCSCTCKGVGNGKIDN